MTVSGRRSQAGKRIFVSFLKERADVKLTGNGAMFTVILPRFFTALFVSGSRETTRNEEGTVSCVRKRGKMRECRQRERKGSRVDYESGALNLRAHSIFKSWRAGGIEMRNWLSFSVVFRIVYGSQYKLNCLCTIAMWFGTFHPVLCIRNV